MLTNYRISDDLDDLIDMVNDLETHVRSDDVYSTPMLGLTMTYSGGPTTTVGGVLASLHRINSLIDQLTPEQRERLANAIHEHDRVASEWHEHYAQKMRKEAHSRLSLISAFLNDYHEDAAAAVSQYGPETTHRTIIHALVQQMQRMNESDEKLITDIEHVDGQLEEILEPAPFLWDNQLKNVYGEKEYWWLYHKPLVTESASF